MAQIFDYDFDYGLRVNYDFEHEPYDLANGDQGLNSNRLFAIANYNLSFSKLFQAEYDSIKAFYDSVNGSQDIFLFEDPLDHEATKDPLDTGLGITSQGTIINDGSVLHLCKTYELDGVVSYNKPITRLDISSVKIYDNLGTEVLGFTLDADTGIVSGAGVDETHTWEGVFYIPVRFENDTFPFELLTYGGKDNHQLYATPDLRLKQVKEVNAIIPYGLVGELSHTYALPWEYNNKLDRISKTDIFTSSSGYESRTGYDANTSRTMLSLSESLLTDEKKDYLLGLYLVANGTFSNFQFVDVEAGINGKFRFTEAITFNFLREHIDKQSITRRLFACSEMQLREEITPVKTTLCRLWKIEKRDGSILALTDHDQSIFYDTNTYIANLGVTGTSAPNTSKLQTDSIEFSSAILNVSETEIISGQLSDAPVEVFLYNWATASLVKTLFTGNLGSYELEYVGNTAKRYQFQCLSIVNKLDASNNKKTSFSCIHEFLSVGDFACNRPIDATVRTTTQVIGTPQRDQFDLNNIVSTNFVMGILRPLNGDLRGQPFVIGSLGGVSNKIFLLTPTPIPLVSGTTVELTARCNKSTEACDFYGNIENFGGQPELMGSDLSIVSTADDE